MALQQLFGRELAVIEFDFLEKINSIEEWNGGFYEIFKWLGDVEEEYLCEEGLHVLLLNDNQIFFKEVGETKVKIHTNNFTIKPEAKKQLIVIYSTKEASDASKEKRTKFVDLFLAFLKEKHIESRIVHDHFMPQLKEQIELEKIIEILIGVK